MPQKHTLISNNINLQFIHSQMGDTLIYKMHFRVLFVYIYIDMQQIKNIWLDCDPGLDDTFAIILAAHHPSINLIGVSTSAGNSTLQSTTRNALDVLYSIKRSDVVVISGSNQLIKGQMKFAEHIHGQGGLGGVKLPKSDKEAIRENNFEEIRNKIMSQDSKIVWANTGSLTNLCFLFRQFPQVKQKISEIVAMGGAIGRGNRTPAAEFNIYFDPEAASQILKTKGSLPIVFIPLELTHQVKATSAFFHFLEKFKQIPLADAIHKMLTCYKDVYFKVHGFDAPPIHDPCVINYIINSENFTVKKAIVEVDTYPTSYGRTNFYFNDPLKPQEQIKTIDLVGIKMHNRKQFWGFFQQIFERLFSKLSTVEKPQTSEQQK